MEVNNRIHSPAALPPRKFSPHSLISGLVGLGDCLNILKNSEISFAGRTPDRLAQCFPNFVASGPILGSKNNQVSSYPCWHKYGMSGYVSKIKNLYLRTDLRYLRIHSSDIHNNELRDFALIKLNVARFVGTSWLLISYLTVIRDEHRQLKKFRYYF